MDEQPERISRVENFLIGLWAVFHLGFFSGGAYLIRHLTTISAQAQLQRQEARLATNRAEPGRTQPERPSTDARPAEVRIGLYIDRVPELSIRDSHWRADLYLWLNWVEPPGQPLTPGQSLQIPSGTILSQVLLRSITTPAGAQRQRYELYRMEIEVSKLFEVGRFPLDSHLLTLNLEDLVRPADALLWVPDTQASGVSSRVELPGYVVRETTALAKLHTYRSNFGDPSVSADRLTYSQFVFGILIDRADLGFYLRLFQALFGSVAIAILALWIKPTDVDPRFGLGVGAFFAAVANTYLGASLLPDVGVVSLMDMINGLGMATIFLTLTQSTISLYLYDRRGREQLARRFDKVAFGVFFLGYTCANMAIPLRALEINQRSIQSLMEFSALENLQTKPLTNQTVRESTIR
ncbi:MAG: hypothetical protein IGQ88_01005 [Gloeomargaritaceae cyanobacterium C42_A2020_066]|nr:hypothetical protein [Gloeomargaritaceae cyanobacterium C42_A2020_066]